jgi:hypothetical protein
MREITESGEINSYILDIKKNISRYGISDEYIYIVTQYRTYHIKNDFSFRISKDGVYIKYILIDNLSLDNKVDILELIRNFDDEDKETKEYRSLLKKLTLLTI